MKYDLEYFLSVCKSLLLRISFTVSGNFLPNIDRCVSLVCCVQKIRSTKKRAIIGFKPQRGIIWAEIRLSAKMWFQCLPRSIIFLSGVQTVTLLRFLRSSLPVRVSRFSHVSLARHAAPRRTPVRFRTLRLSLPADIPIEARGWTHLDQRRTVRRWMIVPRRWARGWPRAPGRDGAASGGENPGLVAEQHLPDLLRTSAEPAARRASFAPAAATRSPPRQQSTSTVDAAGCQRRTSSLVLDLRSMTRPRAVTFARTCPTGRLSFLFLPCGRHTCRMRIQSSTGGSTQR